MHNLLDLIRSLFQYGRGRPAALIILMWTTSISVISEIPLEDKTAQLTGNVTGAFTKARQFLFDGYQKYYPRTPLSQPVTIVAIDEKSLAELGQWPWPRNQLAELLDAIAGYGPAAVGLDMYMPEADQTSPPMLANRLPADTPEPVVAALRELPSNDAVLARSLHNMPSVLGAAGFDHASYTTSAGMRSHPLLVSGGEALPHVRRFPAVLASLPELQAAARGQAILSVDLDFGVVRRVPLIAAIGDTLVSGLAMEMLRLATGDRAVRVQVGSHGIDSVGIADLDVPTQPRGDVWLHFASIDATRHRYVSATSILDGSIDPDLMTGKLVMLGLTGSGLHDMRTTALGELVPGIEIQAQVLESLFDGRFIVRPWWMKWLETSIIVTLGLMLIWYIPRRNSRLSKFINAVPRASAWITLGINLLLIGVGYLAFRTQGLLFDASSFFLVISAVIGSLIASTVIELNRQEKADAAEAQRVREAANLIAGEFAATMDQPIHGSFGNTSPRIEQLTRELASRASRLPEYRAQLTDEQVTALGRAAQHRDIGMAQIPAEVLANASELDDASQHQVRQHAELGAMAVASIRNALGPALSRSDPATARFLTVLEDVARSHHECWDGSGYPEGKSGTAISPEARVVAIIDSWDSLTSERPWRSAMTQDQALDVIRLGAGSRFDPTLAELFLDVVKKQPPNEPEFQA